MLSPVNARLVASAWATRVVAPAADLFSDATRGEYMAGNPDSFLHVTRAYDDDATGERTPEELALLNRSHLDRLTAAGAYETRSPALYLYRLATGDHQQTAVVGEVPLLAYDQGMVRPHERTRTDREDQLALHLRIVGAVASPVAMAHRPVAELDSLVAAAADAEPILAFEGLGGLVQTVWRIPSLLADHIVEVFDDQPLYVTDGHHRLAAALRYRDDIERLHPGSPGPQHNVLAAIFRSGELRTMAFHRVVATESSSRELVSALAQAAVVTEVSDPASAVPRRPGDLGMFHHNRWWRVDPHDRGIDLDVVWLQEQVLAPVLGIVSPRTDPRLGHVPATAGPDELATLCGTNLVAFLLASTPTEAILDAADRRLMLPPKSSYFTPKPRSGIFLVSRRPGDGQTAGAAGFT
jgi:uncharacterized protein (DUF1015 family)